MTIATIFALEKRLRFAVAAFGVPAFMASLAGVARINRDYQTAFIHRFVSQKRAQLRETPRVQTAFGFTATDFGSLANLRQVFQHDNRTRGQTLQNLLGKNVVTIAPEPLLASRKALEVPSGTSRTVRLQSPLQTKRALFELFPTTLPVKAIVARHCRARYAQIHSDDIPAWLESYIRQIHTNVQIPLTFLQNQVRCCRWMPGGRQGVSRNLKCHLLPPRDGREVDNAAFPVQLKSPTVETWRAKLAFGLRGAKPLLLTRERRLDGFAGFLAGLNVQIRHKSGIGFPGVVVSDVVQLVGIAFCQAPTCLAHRVERTRESQNRFTQNFFLLGRRLEA